MTQVLFANGEVVYDTTSCYDDANGATRCSQTEFLMSKAAFVHFANGEESEVTDRFKRMIANGDCPREKHNNNNHNNQPTMCTMW